MHNSVQTLRKVENLNLYSVLVELLNVYFSKLSIINL